MARVVLSRSARVRRSSMSRTPTSGDPRRPVRPAAGARGAARVARRRATDLMTYPELAAAFTDIGTRMMTARVGRPSFALAPDPAHRTDLVRDLVDDMMRAPLSKEEFADRYRDAWPRQDEFFSTASMRSVLHGIGEVARRDGLDPATAEMIRESVVAVSSVRAPTRYVGVRITGEEHMQHPTGGLGLYGDPYDTVSAHNTHDRARAGAAVVAMRRALADSDFTVASVFDAGAVATSVYTVNRMMAPAMAANVTTSPAHADETLWASTGREAVKRTLVARGGITQRAGRAEGVGEDAERDFVRGRGPDSVSPERRPTDLTTRRGSRAGSALARRPAMALD